MNMNGQRGFSLVELILVITIIGIVAAIAVPNFIRGIRMAETAVAISALRTIHSQQGFFYSKNKRFGRLAEIHSEVGPSLGTSIPPRIIRGRSLFEMTPAVPTDAQLRRSYLVTATVGGMTDSLVYKYEVSETGVITQILP